MNGNCSFFTQDFINQVKKDEPLEEIERLKEENAKLKAENASLRERLDRSVELPCKVGDTVYFDTFLRGKSVGIMPHKVGRIRVVVDTKKTFPGSLGAEININEFGKTVFFTEEEARLKELQEGKR